MEMENIIFIIFFKVCSNGLNNLQIKVNTEIPKEVIDKIELEFKKKGLVKKQIEKLTYENYKDVLKKLKLGDYYKHISYIIFKITGKNPPVFTKEQEEKLKDMFNATQEPFKKHKPANRVNYLSYPYVAYKFCEILQLHEFTKFFILLKNRKKLLEQDEIFKKICMELDWPFIPSRI